ncbi:transport-associated protein [Perkinsela sp. CCAP 1560/4]|nr:transport-associated protein [Perkinsela sp. CCAP 1560/4]|eukprot:KNH01392.1 transport-associated protein [Perkinsela sp. CCAP 1560/4]
MYSTPPILQFAHTPILSNRLPYGRTPYGLKPEKGGDFRDPSRLVNFGKGTTPEFGVRMSDYGYLSRPSFEGSALDPKEVLSRFGILKDSKNYMSFCSAETLSLRICMIKGGVCDMQQRALDSCMGRVKPLKHAIAKALNNFEDWFKVNVSDNYTTALKNRPQDWQTQKMQEFRKVSGSQGKAGLFRKYPKKFGWSSHRVKNSGFSKRARHPINA